MQLRMGALQMNSGEDREANIAQALTLIEAAVAKGANFAALPEYFNFLGRPDRVLEHAEPIPGPTTEVMAAAARRHGIWLHCGSIAERIAGQQRHYNTSVILDPSGRIVARYRKIHLFDVNAGGTTYRESATMEPGQDVVVVDTPWGLMGLAICYDLRFGELHRALTLAGAQLLFQPSAFTLYTGKDHWEVLLRARAIENQVYVVAPAQIFKHPPGNACFGSALIVDPWGTVVARAPEQTCAVVADIDYAWLNEVRTKVPALQHRRADLYRIPPLPEQTVTEPAKDQAT